jgi:hypothetical protein
MFKALILIPPDKVDGRYVNHAAQVTSGQHSKHSIYEEEEVSNATDMP